MQIENRGDRPLNRPNVGAAAQALLSYFERDQTFQGDGILKVPPDAYTDPDRLRAEIKLIFKRVPLVLALSCELPMPGDYKAMEVVGLPILISRDKTGKVRTFLNVCAHRWAPVAQEGRGHCQQFRFVCPFHGWTYGADGRLLGVSGRASFGDLDQSSHGLRELPCEERVGIIFGCLTPGSTLDVDGYFGSMLEDCSYFRLEDWRFLGSTVLEGPNWKLILANFFESYHIAAQHRTTLAPQWVSNLNHYEAFGPHMRIGSAARSIGKLRDIPQAQWHEHEGGAFVFMRHFFPNTTTTLYLHGVSSFMQILPGPTPETSRLVRLSVRKSQPGEDQEKVQLDFNANVKAANDIIRDEDFATGIATQKGLQSGAYDALLYGRNERGPQYFHEWVNWYLQDDATLAIPTL